MNVKILYNCSWSGLSGEHTYVIETEIHNNCPICGAFRGNPVKMIAIENDIEYEIEVPSFPCGHYLTFYEMYMEGLAMPERMLCTA